MYHQQILKLLSPNGLLLKHCKMQRAVLNLKKSWVTLKMIELDLDLLQPRNCHQKTLKIIRSWLLPWLKSQLHAKLQEFVLQWTRWCDYIKLDISWKYLLAMPQPLLSFYLGATYETQPSPSNLYRWHIVSEAECFICSKQVCTLAHILGACRVTLH